MIAELAEIVSSQAEDIEELTYQSTLLPAPATKGFNYQRLRLIKYWVGNSRFPWTHSRALGLDAFQFGSVSPCMNHAPVPLCRDPRAMW